MTSPWPGWPRLRTSRSASLGGPALPNSASRPRRSSSGSAPRRPGRPDRRPAFVRGRRRPGWLSPTASGCGTFPAATTAGHPRISGGRPARPTAGRDGLRRGLTEPPAHGISRGLARHPRGPAPTTGLFARCRQAAGARTPRRHPVSPSKEAPHVRPDHQRPVPPRRCRARHAAAVGLARHARQ